MPTSSRFSGATIGARSRRNRPAGAVSAKRGRRQQRTRGTGANDAFQNQNAGCVRSRLSVVRGRLSPLPGRAPATHRHGRGRGNRALGSALAFARRLRTHYATCRPGGMGGGARRTRRVSTVPRALQCTHVLSRRRSASAPRATFKVAPPLGAATFAQAAALQAARAVAERITALTPNLQPWSCVRAASRRCPSVRERRWSMLCRRRSA
jgi:hypothetical protein